MKRSHKKNEGSVLIMALWALGLLTVFTIQIGMTMQDKIAFLSRADKRAVLRDAARAGVYKALAVIKNEPQHNKLNNLLQRSWTLYYNPGSFGDIAIGPAQVVVIYNYYDEPGQHPKKVYGITDEERRLNLNVASRENIKKLIVAVARLSEDDADKIAGNLVDWREYGESEIKGFYSDSSEDLEFPYKEKKALYETLDELRLVQGITEELYNLLLDYVTVYGKGEVNMNTASWPVLEALGFNEEQAKAIDAIRRGPDGIDGTTDDSFFIDVNMLKGKLEQALGLKGPDVDQLNMVLSRLELTGRSSFFRIESKAQSSSSQENKRITCVFNTNDDKIIYWREF